jgi:AraC-like DNA-binding protein
LDGKLEFRLAPEREGRVRKVGDQGYIPAMHWHDELELDIAVRGRASFALPDRKFPMRVGTMLWLFPGQEHVILDQSPDFEMWVCLFGQGLVQRLCTTEPPHPLLARDANAEWSRRLDLAATDRMVQLMEEIRLARRDPPRLNAGLAYLLLTAWTVFKEAPSAAEAQEIHPAVAHAAKLIRTESDTPKLSVLAEQVGLSPSRLSSLFKGQMGVSLVSYRQQQHLQRFLRLYAADTRRTLLETVYEAGFGSYPQFHRVFKQSMGYGPAAYRRKLATGAH